MSPSLAPNHSRLAARHLTPISEHGVIDANKAMDLFFAALRKASVVNALVAVVSLSLELALTERVPQENPEFIFADLAPLN
jgi:hypothetical protein